MSWLFPGGLFRSSSQPQAPLSDAAGLNSNSNNNSGVNNGLDEAKGAAAASGLSTTASAPTSLSQQQQQQPSQPQPQPQAEGEEGGLTGALSAAVDKLQLSPSLGRLRTTSQRSDSGDESDTEAGSCGQALVVGVDTSDASAHAVAHALARARPGDTVHVAYCYAPLQDYVCPEFSKAHDDADASSWREQQETTFQRFMSQYHFDKPDGVRLETHVVAGDPRNKLPELAKAKDADSIVLGQEERSFLSRTVLGSITGDLASTCAFPITIVPPTAEVRNFHQHNNTGVAAAAAAAMADDPQI